MNFVLVCSDRYPDGKMASALRVFLLAEGLAEAGNKVHVLVFRPSIDPGGTDDRLTGGIMPSGVSFRYTGGARLCSRLWLGRRIQNAVSLLGAMWFCCRRRSSLDAILLHHVNDLAPVLMFWLLRRVSGIRVVSLINEHPLYLPRNVCYRFFVRRFLGRIWDDYVPISRDLADFFRELGTPAEHIFRMPIIANDPAEETEARPSHSRLGSRRQIIFYCGDWSEKKDGLLTLIRAFGLIAPRFSELSLDLAGKPSYAANRGAVLDLITTLGLGDRINIHGYLEPKEFRQYMNESVMFVLPKPDNLQNRYAMPSKLAEYLMTGRPVIIADMGDVGDYLSHGVSAYLVPPNSVDAVAAAMEHALLHPEESRVVGLTGRDVALRHFHYRSNAVRLAAFILGTKSANVSPSSGVGGQSSRQSDA